MKRTVLGLLVFSLIAFVTINSASAFPSTITRYIERCNAVENGDPRLAQVMLDHLGASCAGDSLSYGDMTYDLSDGSVEIYIEGTHAFVLYEVYWVTIGMTDADSEAIYVGNFVTNIDGNSDGEKLRAINYVDDIDLAPAIDVLARKVDGGYGIKTIGWFLFYSRGPYAEDSNSNGVIDDDEYNTGGGGTSELANPDLGSLATGVQYVSTGLVR